MNALMQQNQLLTMTSREIAYLTGKRHADVMRDLRVMCAELQKANLRYVCRSSTYEGENQQPYPQYQLDKDTSLTLLLGYDAAARMKVVKRWQELEAQHGPTLPKTMSQALRLAAEQAEVLEQQSAQLEAAKPKVEFVDTYVQSSSGSKGFRQVCKLLNATEPEFRAFLAARKIMYRLGNEWTPTAQHIAAGRFETRAGVAAHGDTSHAYNQAKFTPKGVQWIAAEWAKHRVALATGRE